MQHINWRNDICRPNHIPERGQGVWIDMPRELRPVVARIRMKGADGTEFELQGKKREAMIEKIAESFREEEPWLIRWT